MSNSINEVYEFENFRLDVSERSLWRGRARVLLSGKAFETLCVLVNRSNHLVSRDELLSEVWTDTIVEENNLAKNISLLRKALGVKENGDEFIETVRGHGFRFSADVRKLSEIPEDRPQQLSNSTSEPESYLEPEVKQPDLVNDRVSAKSESRFWLVALGLVSLAGLIFLSSYSSREKDPATSPITSVAVLPFVIAESDPDLEYLSDGLSESLIDRLSELPQLKVIARGSSFKYRGENVDLQDAANKLGVQAIVTGRVGRRGDELSIRVEIIDARHNNQLWGGEFKRKAVDTLSFQREIAHTVSEKLSVKLSGEQEQELAKQHTVNPQAYELLLRGRFELSKGPKVENHRKAVEYFLQAIAADPAYALAFADLSLSYSIGFAIPDPNECMPKAEAAARKALELDERLSEAHHSMANVKLNAWDWAGAESEYLRALELNPNLARAHAGYANYLTTVGRHDQAISESKKARELNPLAPRSNVQIGWALMLAGKYDEAIEIFKKNDMRRHENLGFAYGRKGMYREAAAEFEDSIKVDGSSPTRQIYLGASLAKAGESKKARAILRQVETTESYVSPTELACLYAALDETEKAFESLEKAFAAHDLQLQTLNIDSFFDGLRDDARFQDLVRRVGLPGR